MNKFVFVRHSKREDPKPRDGIYNPVPDEKVQTREFDVDSSSIETAGWAYALLLPKVDPHAISSGNLTYKKLMVECLVHALSDMETSMRPNLRRGTGELASDVPGVTEHAIHEDLLDQFRRIVRVLSHMVNSSSWQGSGPYHDFDRAEINRRLEFCRLPR